MKANANCFTIPDAEEPDNILNICLDFLSTSIVFILCQVSYQSYPKHNHRTPPPSNTAMSTRKGRARQFLKYLVAILLVALSLPFPHTRALGNASSHDVVISSEQTRAGVTTEPEIWNVDEQQKLEGVGVKVASPGVLARGSEQVLKKRELTTVSLVLDAAVAKQVDYVSIAVLQS